MTTNTTQHIEDRANGVTAATYRWPLTLDWGWDCGKTVCATPAALMRAYDAISWRTRSTEVREGRPSAVDADGTDVTGYDLIRIIADASAEVR